VRHVSFSVYLSHFSDGALQAPSLGNEDEAPGFTTRKTASKEGIEKGKTVGILLRLTKDLLGTGKVVILESSINVLRGRKTRIFVQAVIKKRRNLQKHVNGDRIKDHFC
jgi:hypothetical protein